MKKSQNIFSLNLCYRTNVSIDLSTRIGQLKTSIDGKSLESDIYLRFQFMQRPLDKVTWKGSTLTSTSSLGSQFYYSVMPCEVSLLHYSYC